MSLTKTVSLFAGTTLALTGVAFGSTEANTDALQQIADLRAEIASLQAKSGDNWLTEQRAAEIKGLVRDVLSDADTRASLQGAGVTAGFDNGFFIASTDGSFRLNVDGMSQFRWSWSHRDIPDGAVAPAGNNNDENNWGFGIEHAQIGFSGHVFDPSWQYRLSVEFFNDDPQDPNGTVQNGVATLYDAWFLKDFGGFYLKGGQFVAPYSRERMMADNAFQFVDRTNLSYTLGLGRTIGLEAGFINDMFRLAVGFSDGLGPNSPTQNTGYSPNMASPATDFAFSGRAELKLGGNWRQFEEQQSFRGDEFALLLGLGGFYQSGKGGLPLQGITVGTDGSEFGFTADALAKFGGFNVLGALYYTKANSDFVGNGLGSDVEGMGCVLQGGFFLTDEMELTARWEYGDIDNLGAVIPNNLENVFALGFNWYFSKNRMKWQTDVAYAASPMGVFAVSQNGWYQDLGTESGQFLLRTGFTFAF